MTQLPDKDPAPGSHIDHDPPTPSSLPEERENPGDGEQGSSGVGAPKPPKKGRTTDADV